MRSTGDRIRHTVLFEVVGLALAAPLGAWLFHGPVIDIGVVALVGTVIATAWNYGFNLGFDRLLQRLRGDSRKTLTLRLVHAALFELGLMAILLPFVAWYLGIGLWEALMLDLAFVAFYLVYAFVFNWVYDLVFPVPSPPAAASA